MATGIAEYDLFEPSVRWNPHPIYAKMRAEAPVYKTAYTERGAFQPWLLTRYDDCEMLQNDPRFTKNYGRIVPPTPENQSPLTIINKHMLAFDPPDHTRLRGLVHKAFTPRIINEMNNQVQEIADNLLNAVQGRSDMDLIADFAFPLPITVIGQLLGVPYEDREKFRSWSQTIVLSGTENNDFNALVKAVTEFIAYLRELFAERRADPQDDLITNLIQAEEAGDKLTPDELLSMVFLLLIAGHETTVNLIANGTLSLLTHPDQLQLLRGDPSLIRSAIEEMLRFESPVGATTTRWALEDVKLHGQTIPKGDMVLASLIAANRDPEVFENPDAFDIRRNPNPHMAFGYGIHYCLGAPLARMEGAIAVNTLVRRLPDLQLAVAPRDIQWTGKLLLRSMKQMPVSF